MRFWDASALVPLLHEEAATAAVTRIYREDPTQLIWWGTSVECASALARLERSGTLPPAVARSTRDRLAALKQAWQEVQPTEAVREAALRFVRVHPLRTADAFQLAAAVIASEHRPSTLEFVSLDERLCAAAAREGFLVVTL